MPDVKMSVIGTSRGAWKKGKKGDLWSFVTAGGDFGTKEVAPGWLQLTLTGVPGASESDAIANMQQWLVTYATAFDYSEVAGADPGEQRYRVEVKSEIGSISTVIFNQIRNGVCDRFAMTGTYTNQQPGVYFEFDSFLDLPLDEIEFEVTQASQQSRRYQLSDSYVDNVIGDVEAGQPAADTQTHTWFTSNVVDKLD